MAERMKCMCASSQCSSHDCKSASDILYFAILKDLQIKAKSTVDKLYDRCTGVARDYDRVMAKKRVNYDDFLWYLTLKDNKAKLSEFVRLMYGVDDKLIELCLNIDYARVLKMEKMINRIEEQMNAM